jgi:hypothetical protein
LYEAGSPGLHPVVHPLIFPYSETLPGRKYFLVNVLQPGQTPVSHYCLFWHGEPSQSRTIAVSSALMNADDTERIRISNSLNPEIISGNIRLVNKAGHQLALLLQPGKSTIRREKCVACTLINFLNFQKILKIRYLCILKFTT